NETYLLSLFLPGYPHLQLKLASFVSAYSSLYSKDIIKLNEGIRLSATLLIIIPMLIVYLIMQRWFVEGVEKTGITGE
ncbi:MAG: carbohydrate ABC transporter permease, partial [Bacilli bacterium]